MPADRHVHWEPVHTSKLEDGVSWFEADARTLADELDQSFELAGTRSHGRVLPAKSSNFSSLSSAGCRET